MWAKYSVIRNSDTGHREAISYPETGGITLNLLLLVIALWICQW